ncbi:MAG: T9SS type A sorting domain-containing protein [candidate division KSB1 bacterium]|nr:T9SS type A sorting domain-containing protein [candidate division KSB1 bacterium]
MTGIQEKQRGLPREHRLLGNFPNPFNPETEIVFQLRSDARVRLDIWNLLGQRIVTLLDASRPAGIHRIRWNGRNALGDALPSGIYLYRLVVDDQPLSIRRMVLLQ